jgi:hypothetical protein
MSVVDRIPRQVLGVEASSSRSAAVAREVLVVSSGVLLYFLVRGLTVADESVAVENAQSLARWERDVGLDLESAVQNVILRHDLAVTVMNWVYVWGHWPVIAAVLVWLVLRHPSGYRIIRNAMLLSGSIGLIIFVTFPLAPPRLAAMGLQDTVTEQSASYRVLQPKAFVNQYAAMPSLHVGWDLLIGIALVAHAGYLVLRVIGVVLPLAMSLSVVATANHYVIDAVVGVAVVLFCLALAVRIERGRPPPEGHPVGPLPRGAP